jgi:type II secretory pathway pseudopilin PulG
MIHNRHSSGFTLVEILTVVVLVMLLIGVGLLLDSATKATYKSARDSERASDMESVALIFESYYRNNNGTYPTTAQVSLSTVTTLVADKELVTSPGVTTVSLESTTTNSSPPTPALTAKDYRYQPLTASGTLCTAAPCVRFNLYYMRESDGQLVTIESSHQQ